MAVMFSVRDRVAALLADLLADRTVVVHKYPCKGCSMYIGCLRNYNGGIDLFSVDYDDGDSSGEIGLAEVMQYLNTAIEFGCPIEVDQPMPEPQW